MKRELITTADGSHTLYLPEIDEHYHSHYGAIQESRHVFIDKGYQFAAKDIEPLNILEVGWGTGLNALLTLVESDAVARKVHYVAVEPYPLEKELYEQLNYGALLENENAGKLLHQMHEKNWNFPYYISEYFILHKLPSAFQETALQSGMFHLVYYDAFAPGKQEDMWSVELFRKCFDALKKGGVLVTYSSKGQVKRELTAAGFSITKLEGPKGKREMLRAVKK